MFTVRLFASVVCCCAWSILLAQPAAPYKDPTLPKEKRVLDLLSRMTPEEKFRQLFLVTGDIETNTALFEPGLFGIQINTRNAAEQPAGQVLQYGAGLSAIQNAQQINNIQKYFVEKTRLGIPIIAVDEALHGLVRTGATSFPQSIALAATWDTLCVGRVSRAIASEVRLQGIRQVLSPVVNLATDVRWGRVEETYGEDPVLAAAMAVAFVKPFEAWKIITTPKHFAVNHGDGGRDSYPISMNERSLEESYFVPFKACIQQGGSRSIMTSYNSLNGRPASANNWLLNKKLKNEWGFRGFVISDASATGGANVLHFTATGYDDAGKQSIENGQDVIFQTSIEHAKLYQAPFLQGQVAAAKLDSAVARVLRMKFEIGLFENPYVRIAGSEAKDFLSEHRALAKEAAHKSIVLLKNDEKKVLPLSPSVRKIAVIGPDAVEARLGGYSGPGNNPINFLDALRKTDASARTIRFAEGCGRNYTKWNTIKPQYLFSSDDGNKVSGLKGEYFSNAALEGSPKVTRTDPAIDFLWTLYPPHPDLSYDFFSVRWTGIIQSPQTGMFEIGIDGNEGYRLYINNALIIDTWDNQSYSSKVQKYAFEKDKEYNVKIEYHEPSGNSSFRLVWDMDVPDNAENKIKEAVDAARESDLVLVAAGIEEGEGFDRSWLGLPGKQEEMIQRIAETGKPVVIILFGGSAVTMPWLDKANAVVHVWYPGEAGGEAIADILTGKVNPSGKLPITFPMHEGQLPLIYNHKPTGRGDDYGDATGQPLFPFGYGLSYTRFEYRNCRVAKRTVSQKESISISFTLKNAGRYDGDEVVQLYIRDEIASVVRPVKELKAFQRVHLRAGEEKNVTFKLRPDMLSLVNEKMERVVEPGTFRIMIGSSSKDIRLREIVTVQN